MATVTTFCVLLPSVVLPSLILPS